MSDCGQTIALPITVSPSTLSGYTRITDFTFTPNLTGDFSDSFYKNISDVKVVWDFGDGYTLSATTPYESTHSYSYPGNYTVTLYLYDNKGEALINTLTKTVSVFNFLSNKITFVPSVSTFSLKAGVLGEQNAIDFGADVTWQDYVSSGNTIYFTVSGSNTDLYDETYKYAFLLPFHSFYQKSGDDFVRTKSMTLDFQPKYYYLNGSTPTLTTVDASGAKMLGASVSGQVYYFDDFAGDEKIIAALDTSNHRLPDYYINEVGDDLNLADLNYLESNIATLNVRLYETTPTRLVMTSTGHRDMTLPSYRRQGDKFRVWVAAGDSDGNILKYYPKYYLSDTDFQANSVNAFSVEVDSTSSEYVSSVQDTKFPYDSSLSSSYLSSYFYFNYTPTTSGSETITVSGWATNTDTSQQGTLTGSYTYTVFSSAGQNDVYKIGEDFDMAETLKSYRFQEFLLEYEDFFDNVLGVSVGSLSSEPTTYGKTIYEKIDNFVLNNSDVDTCNIDILKKLYDFLAEEANFIVLQSPPELKRLYDLLSIRLKRLVGDQEKFAESFNCFYSSNSALSRNLDTSNPLDASTYVVTAGTNFVARQKFNDEYILIEPQQIPGAYTFPALTADQSTYPLSAFNVNSNWGWQLDTSLSGSDLSQLYDFYGYTDYYSNGSVNNLVDYSNTFTNVTTSQSAVSAWDDDGGIIYELLDNQIRTGLNI